MNQLWGNTGGRIALFLLVFGLIPAMIYWWAIRPPYQRILDWGEQMKSQTQANPQTEMEILPEAAGEAQSCAAVQERYLGRIKQVSQAGELLKFSGLLADALAEDARDQGLQVLSVEMSGQPVRGKYLPASNNARQLLSLWPGLKSENRSESVRLMNLDLPALEWQMTIQTDYSKMFSFLDHLGSFPALVNVAAVNVEGGSLQPQYRLKIRGYYWATVAPTATSP